jgi:hypothetical protein
VSFHLSSVVKSKTRRFPKDFAIERNRSVWYRKLINSSLRVVSGQTSFGDQGSNFHNSPVTFGSCRSLSQTIVTLYRSGKVYSTRQVTAGKDLKAEYEVSKWATASLENSPVRTASFWRSNETTHNRLRRYLVLLTHTAPSIPGFIYTPCRLVRQNTSYSAVLDLSELHLSRFATLPCWGSHPNFFLSLGGPQSRLNA